jgi:hypothetical protein
MLNNQYSQQLADYKEKVKYIKNNIKPAPIGLGSYRLSGDIPAVKRLRHLKGRMI